MSRFWPIGFTREQIKAHLDDGLDGGSGILRYEPMPMLVPLRPHVWYSKPGAHRPHGVRWLYSCTNLTPEGRCSDYDNRPKMCQEFKPGADALCAEFDGPWCGKMRLDR